VRVAEPGLLRSKRCRRGFAIFVRRHCRPGLPLYVGHVRE
jgi:hypothetical protein